MSESTARAMATFQTMISQHRLKPNATGIERVENISAMATAFSLLLSGMGGDIVNMLLSVPDYPARSDSEVMILNFLTELGQAMYKIEAQVNRKPGDRTQPSDKQLVSLRQQLVRSSIFKSYLKCLGTTVKTTMGAVEAALAASGAGRDARIAVVQKNLLRLIDWINAMICPYTAAIHWVKSSTYEVLPGERAQIEATSDFVKHILDVGCWDVIADALTAMLAVTDLDELVAAGQGTRETVMLCVLKLLGAFSHCMAPGCDKPRQLSLIKSRLLPSVCDIIVRLCVSMSPALPDFPDPPQPTSWSSLSPSSGADVLRSYGLTAASGMTISIPNRSSSSSGRSKRTTTVGIDEEDRSMQFTLCCELHKVLGVLHRGSTTMDNDLTELWSKPCFGRALGVVYHAGVMEKLPKTKLPDHNLARLREHHFEAPLVQRVLCIFLLSTTDWHMHDRARPGAEALLRACAVPLMQLDARLVAKAPPGTPADVTGESPTAFRRWILKVLAAGLPQLADAPAASRQAAAEPMLTHAANVLQGFIDAWGRPANGSSSSAETVLQVLLRDAPRRLSLPPRVDACGEAPTPFRPGLGAFIGDHSAALLSLELFIHLLVLCGSETSCSLHQPMDAPHATATFIVKLGIFPKMESACRILWEAGGPAEATRALLLSSMIALRMSTCVAAVRLDPAGCAGWITSSRKIAMSLLDAWEASANVIRRDTLALYTASRISCAATSCAAALVLRHPAPVLPSVPPGYVFGLFSARQSAMIARRVAAVLDIPAPELSSTTTKAAGGSAAGPALLPHAAAAALLATSLAMRVLRVSVAAPAAKENVPCVDLCNDPQCLMVDESITSHDVLGACLEMSTHLIAVAMRSGLADIMDAADVPATWHIFLKEAIRWQRTPPEEMLRMQVDSGLPAMAALFMRCLRSQELSDKWKAHGQIMGQLGRLVPPMLAALEEDDKWARFYGITLEEVAILRVAGMLKMEEPVDSSSTSGSNGAAGGTKPAAAPRASPEAVRMANYMGMRMAGAEGHLGCWSMTCGHLGGVSERLLRCRLCSGCQVARYCRPECQKADWGAHRAVCKALTAGATDVKRPSSSSSGAKAKA